MIRFMTELFPIVPGPAWLKNKTQPIAIQNVMDYLLAGLTNSNGRGGVFEIGGPEIIPYGELMIRYARARGLKRRLFVLPHIPLWLMAFGVGLMTPVPYPIAHALIGGLSNDSVVKHPGALEVFPEVQLIDFDAAARDALSKTHPDHIERVWEDGVPGIKSLKHEGCFILHRIFPLHAKALFGDDRGRVRENQHTPFGEMWIEHDRRSQILFFRPRGLPGFLYWHLLHPFHRLKLRSPVRKFTTRKTK
jgi:hypothetical protein